ncbi:calcium homeostasis endoplasmic reticulum protein isoform X1 [Parasteatoda tepidariorum]|uniref:calcium homeostasis endoplasmic reticulum protein isoform X1 n=1 Tax=Parasteatoda tepidariorum TaxID=114398 RepID=UPI001C725A38|nr:calcium homeostasis endoplasmic reticulum protein isoform X1 [Parasteatoda tepidariorum]
MDLPQPPPDQELKNIIDKLAQFVARNGPEFEHMTKQKQKDNPKFSFLFGGTYFHYYQYRVTTEQAILKQKQRSLEQQAIVQQAINRQSIQTAPWQQHLQQIQDTSQEQIRQSEQNLAAQHQLLLQQQQVQVDEVIRKAQDEKLAKLSAETELELKELDGILQPIIDSCTKDSISGGKGWIFANATTPQRCEVIILYILKRITEPGATFEAKLHLVYLVNDVLHHCIRKNADDLKKVLDKSVVPIFCSTSIGVEAEKQQKLLKLHKLWETNKYFPQQILDQLQNPAASLAAYQAGLIAEFAPLITPITTAIQTQYSLLQKQHQDFVAHLTGQMQQMPVPYAFQSPQLMPAQPVAATPYLQPPTFEQQQVPPQDPRLHHPPPVVSEEAAKPPQELSAAPPLEAAQLSDSQGSDSRHDSEPMNPDDRPADFRGLDMRNQELRNPELRSMDLRNPDIRNPDMRSLDMRNPDMLGAEMDPLPMGMHPRDYPPDDLHEPPYDIPPSRHHPNGRPLPPHYMDDYYGPPFDPDYGPPPHHERPYGRPIPPYRDIPPMGMGPQDMPPDYLEPGLPPIQPPYYDLPAGLMVPLVALEDSDYTKPLEPEDVRLPPPALPTDRLLAAVEQFYCPPTHERNRNNSYVISSEGWEQLGLYEFFKAKAQAKKAKGMPTDDRDYSAPMDLPPMQRYPEEPMEKRRKYREFKSPEKEVIPSPIKNGEKEHQRRSRSVSRSRSRSPELPPRRSSVSPSPPRSPPQRSNRHRSRGRSRSRSPPSKRSQRSPDRRSVSPPTFMGSGSTPHDRRLDESNKGHQLLKKMGWSGAGLGSQEQGIQDPVDAGDVRDRQDMYKGIGVSLNDPYENFRKSKGQAFINRMKARAEELGKM